MGHAEPLAIGLAAKHLIQAFLARAAVGVKGLGLFYVDIFEQREFPQGVAI
jgi:hypothetical protein